jgi:ribose transport system ATP-binding protein
VARRVSQNPPVALLSVRALEKSFGATTALAGVDLEARGGEVHAILGENGAGKSTLMSVLGGVTIPDSGTVLLEGRAFAPKSPGEAKAAGIAQVHQELSLCPHLSIADNVMLGREPTRNGVLSRALAKERVTVALEAAAGKERSLSLDPDARVGGLSPADKQLVEIARALAEESCRVLILDEPTSSLGRGEVGVLFERIRALRKRGLLVLYISHFLEEVQQIADRFTVLRDGRTVGTGEVPGASISDLIKLMTGKAVEKRFSRTERSEGNPVLVIRDAAGAVTPTRASFELHQGEVLGIAGLVGSGRTELLRMLFGLDPSVSGTMTVFDRTGDATPTQRLRSGMGMLSEDRKDEGLVLSMSVADNVTLSRLPAVIPPEQQRTLAKRWVNALRVRCEDVAEPVRDLSGGNQQKVAIARLLHQGSNILLLDQPTRGIDVGAKTEIYALIDRLAAEGKAIVVVSDDLPELLGVCDRVAVMVRGVLGAARPVEEWTEASLLKEAVGGALERAGAP